MFQELWAYIKKRKYMYMLITVMLLIDYGVATLPTKIVQSVMDDMTHNTLTLQSLHIRLLLLGLIMIVGYVSIYIWMKHMFTESSKFEHQLRRRLFAKLIAMRTPYYDKFRSGDMMTRFTSDIEGISTMIGFGAMSLLIALSTMLFVLPMMMLLNWKIALLSTLPIVLIGIIIYWVSKRQDDLVEDMRESVAQLSNEVLEVVEGIRVTRAYGRKELGKKRFEEKTKTLRQKSNHITRYQSLFGRIANVGLGCSTLVVVWLGGYEIQHGTMTIGQVIALQLYTLLLLEPMWVLSDLVLVFQSSKTSFGKIKELLDETDDMPSNGEVDCINLNEMVLENYTFAYKKDEKPILHDLNLTIQKGQTIGIVGKTGSGKTALIRQLIMQYPTGSGTFTINGQPVQAYNRSSIEKLIGFVPQEHVLFSRSVYENIRVGKEDADMIEMAAAIHAASFTQDLERMSEGIETLVGEKGVSISGGQKQRISIARAFIKQPELLVLDDSLSAVDARTERAIIEAIQQMRKDKTTVIVTHRLSAVSHADMVIVLDQGRIVEQGTPEQLLAQKGWYFEQYERQRLEDGEE